MNSTNVRNQTGVLRIPSSLRTLRDENPDKFVTEAAKYILSIKAHPDTTNGWWCIHTDLMKETLTYISDTSNKSPLWTHFREKVAEQLSQCRQCAIKYHRAVAEWELSKEVSQWDVKTTRKRVAALLDWDSHRIIPVMNDFISSTAKGVDDPNYHTNIIRCREAYLESLLSVRLCMNKPILKTIAEVHQIRKPIESKDLDSFFEQYDAIPPGLLALCFHSAYIVRHSSQRALQRAAQLFNAPRDHVLFVIKQAMKHIALKKADGKSVGCFAVLREDTLWSGLAAVFCAVRNDQLERVLKHLNRASLTELVSTAMTSHSLHTVTFSTNVLFTLLSNVRFNLIFDQNENTPDSLLKAINFAIGKRLNEHTMLVPILGLLPPFLGTLRDNLETSVWTNHFDHAFKFLVRQILPGSADSMYEHEEQPVSCTKSRGLITNTAVTLLKYWYGLVAPRIPLNDQSMLTEFIICALRNDPSSECCWDLLRTVLLRDVFAVIRCLYSETDVDMIVTHFMSSRPKRVEFSKEQEKIMRQILMPPKQNYTKLDWIPSLWAKLSDMRHISNAQSSHSKKAISFEMTIMLDLHRIIGMISAKMAIANISDDKLHSINFSLRMPLTIEQRREILQDALTQMQNTIYSRISHACKTREENPWWNQLPYHVSHLLAGRQKELSTEVFVVMQHLAKTFGAEVVHSQSQLMANVMNGNKEAATMMTEGCISTMRLIFTLGSSVALRTFPSFFLWYRILLTVKQNSVLESNDSFKWAQGVMLTFLTHWKEWAKETEEFTFQEVCCRFLSNVRDVWTWLFRKTNSTAMKNSELERDSQTNDQIQVCQRRIVRGLLNMHEIENRVILSNWSHTVLALSSIWSDVPEYQRQVISILQSFAISRKRLHLTRCKAIADRVPTPEAKMVLKKWEADEASSQQRKQATVITNYFKTANNTGNQKAHASLFNSSLHAKQRLRPTVKIQKRVGPMQASAKQKGNTSSALMYLRRDHRQTRNEVARATASGLQKKTSETNVPTGKTKFEKMREQSIAEKGEKRKQMEEQRKVESDKIVSPHDSDEPAQKKSRHQLMYDYASVEEARSYVVVELTRSQRIIRERSIDRVHGSLLAQVQSLAASNGRTSMPELGSLPKPLNADSYVAYWEPLLCSEFAACVWKAAGEEKVFAEKNYNPEHGYRGCRLPFRVEGPTQSSGYVQTLAINSVEDKSKSSNVSKPRFSEFPYSAADVQTNDVLMLDIPPRLGKTPSTSAENFSVFALISRIERRRDGVRLHLKVNLERTKFETPGKDREIFVSKIMSMTTFSRQLDGLWGLGFIPDGILWPILEPVGGIAKNSEALEELGVSTIQLAPQHRFIHSLLKYRRLNSSQADAITRVINSCAPIFSSNSVAPQSRFRTDRGGVSLIQGPPGTGKTSTIMALLSTLLLTFRNKLRPKKIHLDGGQCFVSSPQVRVLICAPSNAAVDELMLRIMRDGLTTPSGHRVSPRMVRVGGGTTLESIQKLELSVLSKNASDNKDVPVDNDQIQKLLSQMNDVKEQIKKQENERKSFATQKSKDCASSKIIDPSFLEKFPGYKEIMKNLDSLYDHKRSIGKKLTEEREKNKSQGAQQRREKLRKMCTILNSASVVFATLNSAGNDLMKSLAAHFDVIIVDEAAQCSEPDVLIPLVVGRSSSKQRGFSHLVLVGDQKQLPATVISNDRSVTAALGTSLFERIASKAPQSVHMLDTQYRMHPSISTFPSTQFYNGRLENGSSVLRKSMHRAFHWDEAKRFGPLTFFDTGRLDAREARSAGGSLQNPGEANLIMDVVMTLTRLYRHAPLKDEIVILSPYKQQVNLLKRLVGRASELRDLAVEVSTIDGIQGREKSVVLISTVRSGKARDIGFVNDERRMNVAITRAKHSLMIFGNADLLGTHSSSWAALVSFCRHRHAIIDTGKNSSALCPELRKDPAHVKGATLPPEDELPKIKDEQAKDGDWKVSATLQLRSKPLTGDSSPLPQAKPESRLIDQQSVKEPKIEAQSSLRSKSAMGEKRYYSESETIPEAHSNGTHEKEPSLKPNTTQLGFVPSKSKHHKPRSRLIEAHRSETKEIASESRTCLSPRPNTVNERIDQKPTVPKDELTTIRQRSRNVEAWEVLKKCTERSLATKAAGQSSGQSRRYDPNPRSSSQSGIMVPPQYQINPPSSNSRISQKLVRGLISNPAKVSQREPVRSRQTSLASGLQKPTRNNTASSSGQVERRGFLDVRRNVGSTTRPGQRELESRLLTAHRSQHQSRQPTQRTGSASTNQRSDRKRVTAPAKGFSLADSQKDMERTCDLLRRAKGYR